MVYLRTVFVLMVCKEASLFGVDSCSCTPASTFYTLLEIERISYPLHLLYRRPPRNPPNPPPAMRESPSAKAVAKAAAPEAVAEAAAVTPTTEPLAPTAALETTEPVLACAARLLFAVRPRRVPPGGLPAVRRVLLPTATGVLVDVAVGVGIVMVANARRTEGVGLARSRVVRRRLRRAPRAFRTGGRRRSALEGAAARPGG